MPINPNVVSFIKFYCLYYFILCQYHWCTRENKHILLQKQHDVRYLQMLFTKEFLCLFIYFITLCMGKFFRFRNNSISYKENIKRDIFKTSYHIFMISAPKEWAVSWKYDYHFTELKPPSLCWQLYHQLWKIISHSYLLHFYLNRKRYITIEY